MPIPKPTKGEKQAKFISRCMGNETMNKEYPDKKERAGICYSQWKKPKTEAVIKMLKRVFAKIEKQKNQKPMEKTYYFNGIAISESFFSLRKELDAAIRLKAGKKAWVVDFSNKQVIYQVYLDGQEIDSEGEYVYYKASYKIVKKAVELTSDPEKVSKEVTYEHLETCDLVDLIDMEMSIK